MISEQALQEFKALWAEEFGEILPTEIAFDEAINLLTIFNHTYRPIKKDWVNEN
jgi:hypothetical protein